MAINWVIPALCSSTIGSGIGGLLWYKGYSNTTAFVGGPVALFGVGMVVAFVMLNYIPRHMLLSPRLGSNHVGVTRVRVDEADGIHLPPMTIFYPTQSAPARDGIHWLPRLDMRYLKGTALYANMPAFLFSDMGTHRLFATEDEAPVKEPKQLIVFSHGLAGYQAAYSAYCMDLASAGAVVIAMEHCDGSAAFSLRPPKVPLATSGIAGERIQVSPPCSPAASKVPVEKDGQYYQPAPDGKEAMIFRNKQLDHRMVELRNVLDYIFSKTTGGEGKPKLLGGLDLSKMTLPQEVNLVGHSFGGATILKSAFDGLHCQYKIKSLVGFDVWGEPVEENFAERLKGGMTGGVKQLPPLKLLDSEQWQRWKENRKFIEEELVPQWSKVGGGASCTHEYTAKTDHLTLSDVGLFTCKVGGKPYTKGTDIREAIHQWARTTMQFISAQPSVTEK